MRFVGGRDATEQIAFQAKTFNNAWLHYNFVIIPQCLKKTIKGIDVANGVTLLTKIQRVN